MNDKSVFAAISRRDAIRLIAATPASGVAFAGSLPASTPALAAAPATEVVDGVGQASTKAIEGVAKLSAKHFEPLVGQAFMIGGVGATLTEVRRGPDSGVGFRQQFALAFAAPQNCRLQFDVAPVWHPDIGRCELHVTQVQDGAALEICFS